MLRFPTYLYYFLKRRRDSPDSWGGRRRHDDGDDSFADEHSRDGRHERRSRDRRDSRASERDYGSGDDAVRRTRVHEDLRDPSAPYDDAPIDDPLGLRDSEQRERCVRARARRG